MCGYTRKVEKIKPVMVSNSVIQMASWTALIREALSSCIGQDSACSLLRSGGRHTHDCLHFYSLKDNLRDLGSLFLQ